MGISREALRKKMLISDEIIETLKNAEKLVTEIPKTEKIAA
jgi:hypothetical protein